MPSAHATRALCRLLLLSAVAGLSTPPPPTRKPVLVLGATGEVGRLVVRELCARRVPVRALVRNTTKASLVLADATGMGGYTALPGVDVVAGDVTDDACLAAALEGASSVIAVSGALRVSRPADFLPWRLFGGGEAPGGGGDGGGGGDRDRAHPYFVNYRAIDSLARLAEDAGVTKVLLKTKIDRSEK